MREKYESLPLAELKAVAKARGIKGLSTMKKDEVVEDLEETVEDVKSKAEETVEDVATKTEEVIAETEVVVTDLRDDE